MGSMEEELKKVGLAGREEKQQIQSRRNENIKKKDIEYKVVEDAEETIKLLIYKDKNGKPKIALTTSQIRKFLTAVNVVRNKVDLWKVNNKDNNKLSADLVMEIKFLKVNLLYQAGREKNVRDFVEKAKLATIINDIGSDLKKFTNFCKYVEALVAYHKYYGGKDK